MKGNKKGTDANITTCEEGIESPLNEPIVDFTSFTEHYKKTLSNKECDALDTYLRCDGNISKTCRRLGISRPTLYNWRKANPKFEEAFVNAQNELSEAKLDFVEDRLLLNIRANNMTAIIYYLNNHGKGRGYKAQSEPAQNATATVETYLPEKAPEVNHTPEDVK